jgi:hypothetical protein
VEQGISDLLFDLRERLSGIFLAFELGLSNGCCIGHKREGISTQPPSVRHPKKITLTKATRGRRIQAMKPKGNDRKGEG